MAYSFSPYMAPAVDPFATGETEEERRRRLEAEAAAAAPGPVAPTPVKQTITYDPVTGEQRMKIEGSVTDLSAANPFTPTVQAPGEMGRGMPAPVAPAAPMAAAAPVAERQLPPGVQMVDGKLKLAPVEIGEGVQLAGPMVPGVIKEKAPEVVTAAQLGSQQFPMTPAPAVAAPPAPAPAPEAATAFNPNTFQDRFVAAASDKDITNLSNLYQTTQDPVQKQIAGIALRDQLSKQVGEEKGRQELAGMSENDIARLLKSKTEEGSWAKMLLLGFISPDLAGKEAAKLGLNDKWAVGQDASGRALIYKTRDGIPLEGYDSTTGARMSATDLITAVGSGQRKLDIVGGTYVNDKTGEVGRVVTDQKTGISYIQTDSGRQPMAGFRPQASGGTLDMQRVAQVQKQNVDLAGDWAKTQMRVQSAGPEAANKYLGEFNAKYGTNYTLSQLSGGPPQIDMNTGQIMGPVARPTAAAGPVAPAAAAVPQVDAAAVARAQGDLASIDREIKRLGPKDTERLQILQQERAKAVQRIQSAGGAVSPAEREAALKVSTAVAEAAGKAPIEVDTTQKKAGIETGAIVEREKLKPGAKAEGEQVATDVKNQAFADRTYDLFKPINEAILKSTGSSIGAGVDTLGGVIGKSTEGSKAIARLNVLSYNILANIPRFEGPQSDIDVQMYKQAAGALNDKTLPIEDRLAALDALRTILQRYDKAGHNDWSFGTAAPKELSPAQKAAAEIERRRKAK